MDPSVRGMFAALSEFVPRRTEEAFKRGSKRVQQGVPNKLSYKHIHKNEKCVNISHNSWCELVEIML